MKGIIGTLASRAAVAAAVVAGLIVPSCTKDTVLGPNEIGGDTDLPLTRVGNVTGMSILVDGSPVAVQDTLYITKSENGIVTFHAEAKIAGNPLAAFIPADLKDSSGNLNADLRFKITSDGIQEFYNSGNDLGHPFTIVKHAGNVGDAYDFTRSDGKHIVRTITEKTGNDEWPLGLLLIKTIATTETPTPFSNVTKIVYRSNHKFGIVYVEYTLSTGTVVKLNLMPWGVM